MLGFSIAGDAVSVTITLVAASLTISCDLPEERRRVPR